MDEREILARLATFGDVGAFTSDLTRTLQADGKMASDKSGYRELWATLKALYHGELVTREERPPGKGTPKYCTYRWLYRISPSGRDRVAETPASKQDAVAQLKQACSALSKEDIRAVLEAL